MATIIEIELALDLPERATLAANLLDSLSGILQEEDEGIAERSYAMRRLRPVPLKLFLSRN